MHKTARANAKLLCEPRLYHDDEILADDFANPARKRRKLISAGYQRNLESELAVDEFDWAFE